MFSILQLLLYLALVHLVVTTVILLDNRRHFRPLPQSDASTDASRKFSICIPARNEEENIERCVRSALNQDYGDFEVVVLDDESSDRTGIILNMLKNHYPDHLHILKGRPKPDHWLGKPWACHQLSQQAEGQWLLFADADTWFENDFISRIAQATSGPSIDALTVWPRQQTGTFWERVVIPMIYFALLTLLPIRWVHHLPDWWPAFIQKRLAPLLAAANGQCVAFRREVYQHIGGHETVNSAIVEDVALARAVRRNGWSLHMFDGKDAVYCRMYSNVHQLREGFRKNFLAGFNFRIGLFIATALAHLVIFILPPVLFLGWLAGWAPIPGWLILTVTLLPFAQRLVLDRWMGWNTAYSFSHPLGVLWFQWLGVRVVADYFGNHPARWKGRPLRITQIK